MRQKFDIQQNCICSEQKYYTTAGCNVLTCRMSGTQYSIDTKSTHNIQQVLKITKQTKKCPKTSSCTKKFFVVAKVLAIKTWKFLKVQQMKDEFSTKYGPWRRGWVILDTVLTPVLTNKRSQGESIAWQSCRWKFDIKQGHLLLHLITIWYVVNIVSYVSHINLSKGLFKYDVSVFWTFLGSHSHCGRRCQNSTKSRTSRTGVRNGGTGADRSVTGQRPSGRDCWPGFGEGVRGWMCSVVRGWSDKEAGCEVYLQVWHRF